MEETYDGNPKIIHLLNMSKAQHNAHSHFDDVTYDIRHCQTILERFDENCVDLIHLLLLKKQKNKYLPNAFEVILEIIIPREN
jgi:hypothetical protein